MSAHPTTTDGLWRVMRFEDADGKWAEVASNHVGPEAVPVPSGYAFVSSTPMVPCDTAAVDRARRVVRKLLGEFLGENTASWERDRAWRVHGGSGERGRDPMSAHHKSPRELHGEHEDNRNEAALRVRQLVRHEEAVRQRTVNRLVNVLVQPPSEPHHFHAAVVRPVSPRRGWDLPDAPGGPSSDFPGAVA